MGFFAARDTQQSQTSISTKLIHVFEEKDKSQEFLGLLQEIESCKDRNELKKLLMDNESLIQKYSPLMHERTKNLENLRLDQIKDRCRAIVVE